FFDMSHELDSRGPLEEFTIESMLIDRLSEERLSLVNRKNDLANALGYMQSNMHMVQSRYIQLIGQMETYAKDYKAKGWESAAIGAEELAADIKAKNDFMGS